MPDDSSALARLLAPTILAQGQSLNEIAPNHVESDGNLDTGTHRIDNKVMHTKPDLRVDFSACVISLPAR